MRYSDSSHRPQLCGEGEVWAEGLRVGIGIQVEGLTKSFGSQRIWQDVTFDLPAGEVSVMLGPSGTG
ncbi:MAG: ABC-type transport system involved in resistance to organic solvent, ATPase component, partial [Mycobacterium sp.]|nr:ABC-type transport system involved in resistance to organic solvent, ATPase component [Mycobacterium sp.]MDT5390919.1 phospholipid/cholesterol/gamma-HCH transport system ATP-binding protein [Mycobacterium sp.]